ncbi:MAG: polysaccharide deacetylase [Actinobacteria bacterium]|nr:polysaccharide deacetylase [Actinomycetota bacterium]MBI3685996.1 polysaccharide deacetylase [Actinomycetota bacterium]
MKRSVLLVGVLVVAVAFTVLARIQPHTGPNAAAGTLGRAAPAAPSPPPPTPTVSTAPPVDPDSFFTPTRLAPGQRPPQFIVVSFDGAGSHQKWDYWRRVAERSHMRFTGFLSGIYLVGSEHRTAYRGPGHSPGRASIGFPATADVPALISDLNEAWRRGYEIGTHYNGHFCSGAGYSGGQWTTADWSSELNQFFGFYRSYRQINQDPTMPTLEVPASSIKGGRTPCLEDRPDQLMPALRKYALSYDSSGIQDGLAWPKRNGYRIWEFPMAYVPMPGRPNGVVSMDYNFWVKQTGSPPRAGNSVADSQQVIATYRRMYEAAYQGNRAPLILGNHFNSWNNNAYTAALTSFVQDYCGRPDTYCVPYRDVIRWMETQDPTVLTRLQNLPAVDTV